MGDFVSGFTAGASIRLQEQEQKIRDQELAWKREDRKIAEEDRKKNDFIFAQKIVDGYNSNKESLQSEYNNALKAMKMEFIDNKGDDNRKSASALKFNETVRKLNEKHKNLKSNSATFLQKMGATEEHMKMLDQMTPDFNFISIDEGKDGKFKIQQWDTKGNLAQSDIYADWNDVKKTYGNEFMNEATSKEAVKINELEAMGVKVSDREKKDVYGIERPPVSTYTPSADEKEFSLLKRVYGDEKAKEMFSTKYGDKSGSKSEYITLMDKRDTLGKEIANATTPEEKNH